MGDGRGGEARGGEGTMRWSGEETGDVGGRW